MARNTIRSQCCSKYPRLELLYQELQLNWGKRFVIVLMASMHGMPVLRLPAHKLSTCSLSHPRGFWGPWLVRYCSHEIEGLSFWKSGWILLAFKWLEAVLVKVRPPGIWIGLGPSIGSHIGILLKFVHLDIKPAWFRSLTLQRGHPPKSAFRKRSAGHYGAAIAHRPLSSCT